MGNWVDSGPGKRSSISLLRRHAFVLAASSKNFAAAMQD